MPKDSQGRALRRPPRPSFDLRTAAVVALAFLIDAGLVQLLALAGIRAYEGRLVALPIATVAAWLIGRTLAPAHESRPPRLAGLVQYLRVAAPGLLANYGIFALVLVTSSRSPSATLLGIAVGYAVGALINGTAARSTDQATGREQPAAAEARPWPTAAFWTALAGLLLALKVLGLALDPQPGFFLGDSEAFIHSALTGWSPPDRSYWYGPLVRLIVGSTESLQPLLIAQAVAGVATALLTAWWAQLVFRPPRWILAAVALACVLEPMQLLFERYVLTEAFTLTALALQVVAATYVAVCGDVRWMVPVLLAGTAVAALRLSLLPVVLAITFVAPLLGWHAGTLARRPALLAAAAVAVLGVAVPRITTNIYDGGNFLLGAWAPLAKPADFADRDLGARLLRDLDYRNPELFTRELNFWLPGGLKDRLIDEFYHTDEREQASRMAARNILLRDPAGVLALGAGTYARMWNGATRLRLMQWDIGQLPREPKLRNSLARSFRMVVDEYARPTLASRYYLGVGYWLAVPYLVAPLLLGAAALRGDRRQRAALGLLAFASGVALVTIAMLSLLPVIRYLQPIGWMLVAGCLPVVLQALASFARRAARRPLIALGSQGNPPQRDARG